MQKYPKILIIGRPNVGKSTLFNQILGKNSAITLDTPGVTRDLNHYLITKNNKKFYLIDSCGVLFTNNPNDLFQDKIEHKIKKEIEKAEKIIFIVDYKNGLNPYDKIIADFLRQAKEKVFIAVNKMDNPNNFYDIHEFQSLGFHNITPISALNNLNINQLLEQITKDFPISKITNNNIYKIAIVGRPNVGKSSFINAIINDELLLVSDIPGTTRDAIEIYFKKEDKEYHFIDTAGLRKKAQIKAQIEFFSTVRTNKAIKNSDLTILLLEPGNFLCEQDKKILNTIIEQKRCLLIFVNKWDLTARTDAIRQDLIRIAKEILPTLNNFPFIFGSAKEKINIHKIFELIPEVLKNNEKRISTADLNKFINEIINVNPPTHRSGKHLRIFYGSQIATKPPQFVFFMNYPKLITDNYKRFLEKRLRSNFKCFEGVPIQLYFKPKGGNISKC